MRIAVTERSDRGGAGDRGVRGGHGRRLGDSGTPLVFGRRDGVGLSGTVVLQDNGGDDLSVSSGGPFTFATPVVGAAPTT